VKVVESREKSTEPIRKMVECAENTVTRSAQGKGHVLQVEGKYNKKEIFHFWISNNPEMDFLYGIFSRGFWA